MLGLHAISGAAISSVPGVYASGVAVATLDITDSVDNALYAASSEFITRATDTPPNTPFLGTLVKPVSFSRSLVNGDGFGRISVGYGELELINAEADYDAEVESFGVDGRRIVLKVGAKTDARTVGPYNEFVTVADLQATGWHADDEVLRVSVRDKSYLLEVPTQPNVYDGTGGLNGGPDLLGKRKPLAVGDGSSGEGANATPELVIPNELIYQVHDGALTAIPAVYDSGFTLTATSDYATLPLLSAAVLVPGQYATCIALGIFRLGGAANGTITCDFTGADTTVADIIHTLIENAADVAAADFDEATFALFNVLQPAAVRYHLDSNSNETLAQTISNLVGISGWAGFTRLGLIEIRRFEAPDAAAVEYFEETDFITMTRERLPDGIDPVVQRIRVTWGHNFTEQGSGDLVGYVIENDPDRVAYLAKPHRVATTPEADAAAILADHPLAKDPEPIELYFALEADAQTEADRLFALYGDEHSLYKFTVQGMLFLVDVGDTVHMTYPRWNLSGGQYGRAVAVDTDVEANRSTITVLI